MKLQFNGTRRQLNELRRLARIFGDITLIELIKILSEQQH